ASQPSKRTHSGGPSVPSPSSPPSSSRASSSRCCSLESFFSPSSLPRRSERSTSARLAIPRDPRSCMRSAAADTVRRMNTITARTAAVSLALLAAAPVTAAQAKKHKAPRPDLAVTSVSKPPATSAGAGRLSITVKVKNRGKATAKKSTVGLYLATRSKHSSKDLRLARKSVSKLKKGKTAKVTIKATLPAVAAATAKAGTYRLIACADDRKKVKESNERNNCKASSRITLTAPPKQTPPPPAPNPAAPAFTLADGIDWGFVDDASGHAPAAGDHVTATLTAANGLPGQAGYARSSLAPQA